MRWNYLGNTACGRKTLLDLDVRVRAKECARKKKLGIELAVARSPRGESCVVQQETKILKRGSRKSRIFI